MNDLKPVMANYSRKLGQLAGICLTIIE